jgi:hypothetical protein
MATMRMESSAKAAGAKHSSPKNDLRFTLGAPVLGELTPDYPITSREPMRKYLPYAPNGMQGVWYWVNGLTPTVAGTYAVQTMHSQAVASGPSTPGTTLGAWCALIQAGTAVGYIGTTTKLYLWDGASTFTDKSKGGGYTNTATDWSFAQYGNITIATNGVNTPQFRDSSGSSAFADLTAAPISAIVTCQSNAVLFFNQSGTADGWYASDVGDYTNYTTGEAANGRLIQTPGPITAAIPFADYVLVFKKNAVFRVRYVGGVIKWSTEVLCIGRGAWNMHDVCNCGDIVVFSGPGGAWKFDGSTFTEITQYIGEVTGPAISLPAVGGVTYGSVYSPWSKNVYFYRGGTRFGKAMVYNVMSDRWGREDFFPVSGLVASGNYVPVRGEPTALNAFIGTPGNSITTQNGTWIVDLSATPAVIKNNTLVGSGDGVNYVSAVGGIEGIGGRSLTKFTGLDVDYTSSAFQLASNIYAGNTAFQMYVYSGKSRDGYNLNLFNSGAVSTLGPISSSSAQRRFDFTLTDVYARFVINVPDNTGYCELNDYTPVMAKVGAL